MRGPDSRILAHADDDGAGGNTKSVRESLQQKVILKPESGRASSKEEEAEIQAAPDTVNTNKKPAMATQLKWLN